MYCMSLKNYLAACSPLKNNNPNVATAQDAAQMTNPLECVTTSKLEEEEDGDNAVVFE